ncbi:glycosyltransferase family 2 protein [Anaeromicropila herbilytica]|uniref:Glycosyltransferase 2-like domain-containing protein n=1 Tax=Anaeromicropila herbilytica TaxID=2785025 RepID=A0A7R7IEZ3_9FIRM|nr:glycosyltransferase [Anaeromicropila herbilytica]BCN32541.1 hypothetical protein bsdtb5_38360 [Anaeromicropila herbilytica]
MELISIVVITYNSQDTVIETLDSIKNQTYANKELIVSDDCSTDNTRAIIKEWVKQNSRYFKNIKCIKTKQNKGVSNNCNVGIKNTTGKYIQLIAGDDILLPTALQEKYNFAIDNNLDFVCCKVEVFGKNINKVNAMKRFCENGYRILNNDWENQYKNILIDNYIAGPSGGFYTKKLYDELGGFDNRFPFLEDYPFLVKLLSSGRRIILMDKVLAKYRMSNSSLCTTNNTSFNKSVSSFFLKVRWKLLLKNGMYKEMIQQAKLYI